MKVVILLAILCVVYSSAEYVTTFGDCTNFPLIGRSRAYEKAYKNTIRTKVIKYPMGINEPNFVIKGIKYSDYESVQSNVTIVDGEMGKKRIWIKVQSQRGYGIKVLFEFCGERTESLIDGHFDDIN
ncbi:uncharacterized protein LOC116341752 [Contarinia nasturtii]|uniref:uncharacterized protein LOC116341752 n=1 Tax=Contarinia nasturtii TaxID=265458 RepID=UPI0012D38DBB|nr:uncharacterized protein LOC116341752 [Contarinia nasturtii]